MLVINHNILNIFTLSLYGISQSPHQKDFYVSTPFYFQVGHVTCFVQWKEKECEMCHFQVEYLIATEWTTTFPFPSTVSPSSNLESKRCGYKTVRFWFCHTAFCHRSQLIQYLNVTHYNSHQEISKYFNENKTYLKFKI